MAVVNKGRRLLIRTRILFIAERFPPDLGGLASSANRLSRNLCQLGVEVDVLAWSRFLQPGEVLQPNSQLEINSPQIYRVGLYRNWDMTMIHTLNILDWLQQQHSYDAVWGHYLLPAGFLAVWFAKLQGLKSVVSARGNDLDRGVFPPGDFARLQWTLQQADVITSVSQDLANKIKLVSERNDILIIKNAVNTDIFAPSFSEEARLALRDKLGIAKNEIVLGFAGELREKKGQNFLLQALSQVRQHHPACLLIIGEIRTTQEAILQVYSVQHPEDYQRLIITGHLVEPQEVAQYLQLCDLFLLPSIWEGLPNALLEAMACGCCCLASDAGGIPEIIEHGVNGFILPRQQLQHLGNAVLEFLELDLNIKQKISQAARDRILAEFFLSAEKARLQTVLDRLGIKMMYD